MTCTCSSSLAITGLLRLPDPLAQIHAASKALAPGTRVVLAATVGTGDLALIARAALVGVSLLMTTSIVPRRSPRASGASGRRGIGPRRRASRQV